MNLSEQEHKFFMYKYKSKIASTKHRKDKTGTPINMLLSFEEYVTLYKDADVLPVRPYVLARKDDLGDYVIGNVEIKHNLYNVAEHHGKTSDEYNKMVNYAITHNYSMSIVKSLIRRNELSL